MLIDVVWLASDRLTTQDKLIQGLNVNNEQLANKSDEEQIQRIHDYSSPRVHNEISGDTWQIIYNRRV